jgi:hypothetical protein
VVEVLRKFTKVYMEIFPEQQGATEMCPITGPMIPNRCGGAARQYVKRLVTAPRPDMIHRYTPMFKTRLLTRRGVWNKS